MYPSTSSSSGISSSWRLQLTTSYPKDLESIATINEAACKANCGIVAMRVFHFLEEGKLTPIGHNECKEPEPMSTLSLFGRLDDDFISKGLRIEQTEGSHLEKIRTAHDLILSSPPHDHAVISFKYNSSGKEKGHFCNILRTEPAYLIIDAINKDAFYRYIECTDLWQYFQKKLPRMGAEEITSLSIIH